MKPMMAQMTWDTRLIKVLFFLSLIVIKEITCQENDSNTTVPRRKRSISGVNADITSFPHAVALLRNNTYICNGNILDPFHVITACHCVYGETLKNFQIRAGSSYWKKGGSLHDVISYSCDPRYDKYFEYDVAIIVVNKPFELDNITRRAISIWKPNKRPWYELKATSAGWGISHFEIKQFLNFNEIDDIISQYELHIKYPEQMQYLESKFADPRKNSRYYRNLYNVTQVVMSTGMIPVDGSLECRGDSGGGVVVDGQLAGIHSSSESAECNKNYWSADPSMSINWIETFVNSSMNVIKRTLRNNGSVSNEDESIIKDLPKNKVWDIKKSPHVVSILYNDAVICSGSIVSDSYVVTAANCFKNISANDISVRSGSSYWHMGGNFHRVKKIYPHPDAQKLSTGWVYNVAVVQIDGAFNFDYKTEQPINIYSYNDFKDIYYPNVTGRMYGWGDQDVIYNDTEKRLMPRLRLQLMDVNLEDHKTCYDIAHIGLNQTAIKHHTLCSLILSEEYKWLFDTVQIGSGLVVDNKLAGVYSKISNNGNNTYQQFTAISSFSRWLNFVIKTVNKIDAPFFDELQ